MSGERVLPLLSAIAGGAPSQRELSRRVGLSLGGVNELLRSLIKRGFVEARALDGRPRGYALTGRGRAELARLIRDSAKRAVLELLKGPGLPPAARRPASRLVAALKGPALL